MKINNFLTLFLIVTICYSCTFKKPQIESIQHFTINSINDDTLNISVYVNIHNPNSFSIKLNKIQAGIFYQDNILGATSLNREEVIAASSFQDIQINAGILMPQVLSDFQEMIDADSVRFIVAGTFKGSKWFFSKTVYDTSEVYINVKKEFALFMKNQSTDMIKIEGIKPVSIRPNQTTMSINLIIDNQLPFEYSLDSVFMTVHMTDQRETIAVVSLYDKVFIYPKSSSQVKIESVFNHNDLIKGLGGIIMGGERFYHFRGHAYVTIMNISLQLPLSFENPIIPGIKKPF